MKNRLRFRLRSMLVLCAICCVCVAAFSYVLCSLFWPLSPTYYAEYLVVDPETYSELEELAASDFSLRIYAYEQNQYVAALRGTDDLPSVADEDGCVPALKFDGDTFVILQKWINESGGLAISDDPDFAAKLEAFDDAFRVEHVEKNIFHWDLNWERDSFR